MYRLGKQTDKHRRGRRVVLVGVLLIVVAAMIYGVMHLRILPDQEIRNAPPVSNGTSTDDNKKVTIDKPLFTMELPAGWREIAVNTSMPIPPKFSFRSQSKQSQVLDLYIDTLPTTMAVNRAIVVSGQGDGLSYDTVSDNCTTFTESSLTDPRTGTAPGKWQTINFICDMANAARAVVGTMSTEGINQVTVKGPKSGSHKFFMTYADNNISPNYSTLYAILGSLHFK